MKTILLHIFEIFNLTIQSWFVIVYHLKEKKANVIVTGFQYIFM